MDSENVISGKKLPIKCKSQQEQWGKEYWHENCKKEWGDSYKDVVVAFLYLG